MFRPRQLFTKTLHQADNRWNYVEVRPALSQRQRNSPSAPTTLEVELHEAVFHRAVVRGFAMEAAPRARTPRPALEEIGFTVDEARKLISGLGRLHPTALARIFADYPPEEIQLESHVQAVTNSLHEIRRQMQAKPEATNIDVRVGRHDPVRKAVLTSEVVVVASLMQFVEPDPEATDLGRHLETAAETTLLRIHAAAFPTAASPTVDVTVSSCDTRPASAEGVVTAELAAVDLSLPTRRDPLATTTEEADFRAWGGGSDDPLVLDVVTRYDDGRPDIVVALRTLPSDDGAIDVLDADARIDWSGTSPAVRWLREDDDAESRWQNVRWRDGRDSADARHAAGSG